jgi:hypothetical protein
MTSRLTLASKTCRRKTLETPIPSYYFCLSRQKLANGNFHQIENGVRAFQASWIVKIHDCIETDVGCNNVKKETIKAVAGSDNAAQ